MCIKFPVLDNRQNSVLYRFKCSCDSAYIGKTSRRLQDRINEHVPPNVRKTISQNRPIPPRKLVHSSAIAEHLLNNSECGKNYHHDMFKILTYARSPFHLSILKSIYITYFKPILCKQKQFVYSTVLFKWNCLFLSRIFAPKNKKAVLRRFALSLAILSAVLTFLVDKSMSELKRIDRKRFSESVFKLWRFLLLYSFKLWVLIN